MHLMFILTDPEQTTSLIAIISQMVAPRFHTLRLDGCDTFGFESLAANLNMLNSTRSLEILNGEMDFQAATNFTRRMTRVERLDLDFAPAELMQALARTPTLCPVLGRLDWRGMDTSGLDSYLKSRETAGMDRLDTYRPI